LSTRKPLKHGEKTVNGRTKKNCDSEAGREHTGSGVGNSRGGMTRDSLVGVDEMRETKQNTKMQRTGKKREEI